MVSFKCSQSLIVGVCNHLGVYSSIALDCSANKLTYRGERYGSHQLSTLAIHSLRCDYPQLAQDPHCLDHNVPDQSLTLYSQKSLRHILI